MKFLILTLIVLSAGLICEAATPQERRDDLLQRGRFLILLLEGEIKLLTFEGHTLQAEALESELKELVTVEIQLRATAILNSTDSEINRLDNRLSEIETRINQHLTQVGRQFYTRQEIERLARRTRELIDFVNAEVKLLRQQNRTLEAQGLLEEERRLLELEIAIAATQNPTELRRLEELLIELDYRVVEMLGSLGATKRKRRDLKDDVMKRADELIAFANTEIRVLLASQRNNSAELIQISERNLQRIATQLRNATNASVIEDLEEDLLYEEIQLMNDLARVGRPVTTNETRQVLLTNYDYLNLRTTKLIASLKTQNRTQDIANVEAEQKQIMNLITLVKNAKNEEELRALEDLLEDAEDRLFDLIDKLGEDPADQEEVQEMLHKAEEMAIKLTIEIRALFVENRTVEARGLIERQQELVQLDIEIRSSINAAELRSLMAKINTLQDQIEEELDRIPPIQSAPQPIKRAKRDLKADLLKRASELIKDVENAIVYFRAQNRTQAVVLLLEAEANFNKTIADLNAYMGTNATMLLELEEDVLELEFQLYDDLRRLGRPLDVNERKDQLLTAVDALHQIALSRIAKLKAENRTQAIQRIEVDEQHIASLAEQLRSATNATQLDRIEEELHTAEERFMEVLEQLEDAVVKFEDVQLLIRKAEELAVRVELAIRTLRQQAKEVLVQGFENELRQLIEFDVELRIAVDFADILDYENKLKAIESRVEAELKRLGL